jgi:hypothetical protein
MITNEDYSRFASRSLVPLYRSGAEFGANYLIFGEMSSAIDWAEF